MPSPKKPVKPPELADPLVKIDTGNLPEVDPNAPLIGDYLANAEINPIDPGDAEPSLPGFSMSDDPDIPEEFNIPVHVAPPIEPQMPPEAQRESWRPPDTGQVPRSYSDFMNQKAASQSPSGNFLPPVSSLPPGTRIRYEGRVRIIEAWCFNGRIQEAPPFVDRNWLAYGSHDDERGIPEGPMIQMPNWVHRDGRSTQLPDKICRIGDYVVKQEVLLDAGRESHVKVEVWQRDEFEKVFIPVPVEEGEDGAADPPGDTSQAA
jgi:hypothetical protein